MYFSKIERPNNFETNFLFVCFFNTIFVIWSASVMCTKLSGLNLIENLVGLTTHEFRYQLKQKSFHNSFRKSVPIGRIS